MTSRWSTSLAYCPREKALRGRRGDLREARVLNALGHSGVDRDSIPAARGLLQRLKLHVDPILRRRGWRVKHLHEHNGRGPGGMCYHDLQGTADISIRLRAVAGVCLRKPCQG